jgi:hypothetical protein
LKDLSDEQEELARSSSLIEVPSITEPAGHPASPEEAPKYSHPDRTHNRVTVSFGVTAADHIEAGHNLSGWKVSVLSKTYHAVSGVSSLIKAAKYQVSLIHVLIFFSMLSSFSS